MAHNEKGEEILDQTPAAIPLHLKRPMTLNERIAQLTRQELSQVARDNGLETFDEADDFDTEDEENPDPHSPWEENFDPNAPFIGAREAEIRHGQVQDIDHSKIQNGINEAHKLSLSQKASKKPKAKAKAEPRQETEESDDDSEELQ